MNDDVRARLDALERRQVLLRQELAGLDETLAALKQGLQNEPPPSLPPPVPGPLPPHQPVEAARQPETVAPVVAASPLPVPAISQAPEASFEMRVGTVWLARIGIVIVLTGLVFLANYAWKSLVENFGAIAKLGLLYLAGGALCAVGLMVERGRESLKSYARVLIAGGMAAIYYTTYAAYYIPSMKVIGSPILAGVLLVALAVAIGWMAERRNSQATAGLAIVLAFYASAVNPIAYFTLSSNAILGIAAVVLMARKRWMTVPFLALAATYWSYLYWRLAENWRFWEVHVSGDNDLAVRVCFLSVYWIIFTAGAFLATGPKVSAAARVVFSILNDAAFFCLTALAISSAHHDSLWIVSLVFGLVQFALSLAASKIHGTGAASAWLAKALFFLTLAILIHFTANSLAVILAVECSLLVFAARQFPSRVLAAAGPLAGILAMLAGMASLGAGTAGAAGLVAALLAGTAWFCGRRPDVTLQSLVLALSGTSLGFAIVMNQIPDRWEAAGIAFMGLVLAASLPLHKCRELAFSGLLAAAGTTLVQLTMLESSGRWPSLVAVGLLAATAVSGRLVSGDDRFIKIPSRILAVAATLLSWAWVTFFHDPLPLTAAWALLALAGFVAGFLLRDRIFRLGGLGILALALGRIILFDVWGLELPLRVLSFLVLGGVLLLLGYLYNRYADRIRQWI
ncbi:MAG: DUF2339 domain-containing protein [Verrucomicrobiota bacterium]